MNALKEGITWKENPRNKKVNEDRNGRHIASPYMKEIKVLFL